jgi:TnpA family transposase
VTRSRWSYRPLDGSPPATRTLEGQLRHDTEAEIEKNYVDSHRPSEVAFASCHLLGFQPPPRLKAIQAQKLYRPESGQADAYPNLQPSLTRPINGDLIRQQYRQMIKYATALRLGAAETEAILRRFTRNNLKHPMYQALAERRPPRLDVTRVHARQSKWGVQSQP